MRAPVFELPVELEACEPPEVRGTARDDVRLLVARRHRSQISHARFGDLTELLAPGDLLVINTSATLAAAVGVRRANGTAARVHFATRAPRLEERWRVVELRSADGARPVRPAAGERLELEGGAALELVAPYASGARLMLARFDGESSVERYLERHGDPIRYGYVKDPWPLEAYQNVYAAIPGSAEMPSAGRPFTRELIGRLAAAGVLVAPITLHAGVSSPEQHEPPYPEPFDVPQITASLIGAVRGWGGRVVAVGTTVVRALEAAAASDGTVDAASGWAGLLISPARGLRVVDAVLTGWHEPAASHLQLLEAAAGSSLLRRSYAEALRAGYLWHEFGDSHLILP